MRDIYKKLYAKLQQHPDWIEPGHSDSPDENGDDDEDGDEDDAPPKKTKSPGIFVMKFSSKSAVDEKPAEEKPAEEKPAADDKAATEEVLYKADVLGDLAGPEEVKDESAEAKAAEKRNWAEIMQSVVAGKVAEEDDETASLKYNTPYKGFVVMKPEGPAKPGVQVLANIWKVSALKDK